MSEVVNNDLPGDDIQAILPMVGSMFSGGESAPTEDAQDQLPSFPRNGERASAFSQRLLSFWQC